MRPNCDRRTIRVAREELHQRRRAMLGVVAPEKVILFLGPPVPPTVETRLVADGSDGAGRDAEPSGYLLGGINPTTEQVPDVIHLTAG